MKKRIIILGSIVVALIVLWTAAWFVASGIIQQNVLALASADGVETPNVACGTLNVGGYPFRFDVDCAEARIVSADIVVDVPGIRASVRVYAPFHLLASAQGPLQLTDSFTGTRNSLAWSTLEASVNVQNWRIQRLSVSGKDVIWSDRLFGDAVIAQSPLVELHLFDISEQHDPARGLASLAAYGRAQGLAWPGLTLTGTDADVELELSGLPDDVRLWGDTALLPAIQQAGGKLNIVRIHATDADSVLDATGTLGLDEQATVDGQVAITSTGVAERIGPMIEEPWRTLVLGTPGADGVYTNQLTFKNGAIFSGLVPIASVPPLF